MYHLNGHFKYSSYFPRGGGHVRVEITPVHMLHSISLMDRGEIGDIGGISFVAGNLPVKVFTLITFIYLIILSHTIKLIYNTLYYMVMSLPDVIEELQKVMAIS